MAGQAAASAVPRLHALPTTSRHPHEPLQPIPPSARQRVVSSSSSSSSLSISDDRPRPPGPSAHTESSQSDRTMSQEPHAEGGGAESPTSGSSNRKKRTRPVSACEACRAHKVKCILKADQPVCERCSASGKECLFRVDDLRPDFRAERFAHMGPPGKDAREIKSKPKNRRRSSSKSVALAGSPPTSSGLAKLPSQSETDELDDSKDDLKPAKSRKRSAKSGSQPSDEAGPSQSPPPKTKTKPVFRSYANPSHLAAPAVAPASSPPPASYDDPAPLRPRQPLQANHPHPPHHDSAPYPHHYTSSQPPPPPPPPRQSPYPGSGGAYYRHPPPPSPAPPGYPQDFYYSSYSPGPARGAPRGYETTGPGFAPGNSYQGSGYAPHPHAPHSAHHPPPPPPPPPSHPSPVPGSSMHPLAHGPPYEQPLFQPGPSPAAASGVPAPMRTSVGPGASPSSGSAMRGYPSNLSDRGTPTSSSGAPDRGPPLPPIRMAFPGLGSEGPDTRGPPYGSRHGPSDSVSATSDAMSDKFASSPSRTTPRSMGPPYPMSSERRGKPAPISLPVRSGRGENGDANLEERAEEFGHASSPASHAQASAATAGSQGSKGSAKKTSLVVPFFRWFGLTANTPGYRRIKVAVNPDLPEEEDEDALPSAGQDQSNGEISANPAEPPAVGHDSPKSVAASPAIGAGAATAASTPSIQVQEHSRVRAPSGVSHHHFPAFDSDSVGSSSSRDLFDASRPRYPRKDILVHLSELFVKFFRTNLCPWVKTDELMRGAAEATLPSILANAICAMTARFSDWAELTRKPPKSAGEPFSEMAKTLIVPMLSWPSLDVIEALILLSYAEFGAGSDSGLWMYSGMGMRMAMDLGIQHESTIQSLPTPAEQAKARWLFWSGCYAIDRITCFGTGRPVTMLEHAIDCLPPKIDPGSDCFYASQIIQILLRRGRMGELLNRKDDALKINEKKTKLMEMWQECATYFQSLPSSCAFSVQSFKRAASNNEGAAFLFLHVLFQSTISLLERPGLMRGREMMEALPVATPNVTHISASTSRSIVDMISLAAQVDPLSFQSSPYLDQLILPTGRAFIGEREAIKEAMRQCGYMPEQSRQGSPARGVTRPEDDRLFSLFSMRKSVSDNLQNCVTWLGALAHFWGGASWPARALEQEAAGAADVVPDERDDDAMQAPLRDMELLSSWAKDKIKQAKGKMGGPRNGRTAEGTPAGEGANVKLRPGSALGAANVPSPGAATSIANLLAAADAAGQLEQRQGGDMDLDLDGGSGDNPLGLALSGQLATSAEIDIHALVDLWAAEQERHNAAPSNSNEGLKANNAASNGTGASGSLARPWADSPSAGGGAGQPNGGQQMEHVPQQQQQQQQAGLAMFASGMGFGQGGYPPMDFSALQLEELLSTDLGMGSGDDVLPLELPAEDFPGAIAQHGVSSALFGFH